MFYDVSYLWVWLALALLLGGAIGWRTESSAPQGPWFYGWVKWVLIALAVGLVAAIIQLLPGRVGYWLETAVLFGVAYAVGCLAGGALKRFALAM